MGDSDPPTIDLSPFGVESLRKKPRETIADACTKHGVFYIENHGVSLETCKKFLELNNKFFKYSTAKKKKSAEIYQTAGNGYGKMNDKYHDYEYVLLHKPDISLNGVPVIQPAADADADADDVTFNEDYKKTYKELFESFLETAQQLEEIINDSLGLPKNTLKNLNNDRSWDYMLPMYYSSSDKKDIGIDEHEDPNFITITLQDDVSGLEVLKDKKWIPTPPTKVKLTVVVSDIVQVLSNKKYRNVTHKALKNTDSTRLAIDFAYSFGPDKWIKPLSNLTTEIGATAKYKGFQYKEYIDLIANDYKIPPAKLEDFINLSKYEI